MAGEQPKPIIFKPMKTKYYPEWGFRPGTPMFPIDMNFIFLNGGMGDYITWMTPIRWLASQATWINGTLIVPTYFRELAEYWLRDYPLWGFADYNELKNIPRTDQTPFRGPVSLQQESLNATGAHLSTCGWVYFTNKEGPPPGWEYYSRFNQPDLDAILAKKDFGLPERYAVITAGVTTNSRRVAPQYWNYVIDHVLSRGLTPVFLGKSVVETGNAKNIHTEFGRTLQLDRGLNLLDKTTLMEAAAIISKAAVIIGHDNGLLHLAGCTDTPIVFGYNLASPEHRRPARTSGRIYDVHLQDGELACNFCQSKTNFVIGYNFRECFYRDLKCMDMLFDNEGKRWKDKIDEALGGEL